MRRSAFQEHTARLMVLALIAGPPAAALAQTKATSTTTTTTTTSSAPAAAGAAAPAPSAASGKFSADQLEQLVAPIALYSDSLLMQIMMAATYPLEIVEADRFMQANPGLKDAQLDEKLKELDWDASVKSLCKVPDVLKKMSENLDWTQDLGDAFLAQQTEILDTVQRMRGKAHDSGNLKTTQQQTVTVQQDKIIVIESPSPEVVYVPSYSPTVVYGSAWAPPSYYYPPMYPYYPPGAGLVTFGVGMAMGAAIWGDCNWGWGGSDVNIDVDRYNNFNRNTNINADRTNLSNRSGNRSGWQHDASHRQGVNYRDSGTASKYGAKQGSNRVSRDQARGHSGTTASGQRQARTPREGGASATSRDRSGTTRQGQGGSGTRGELGSGSRGSGSGSGTRDLGSGSRGSGTAGTRDVGSGSRGSGSAGSGSRDLGASGSRGSGSGSRDLGSSGYSGSRDHSSRSGAYSGSSRPSTDRAASSRGASSRGTSSYGGGGGSRGSFSGGGGSRGGGGGGSRGGGGGGGRRR